MSEQGRVRIVLHNGRQEIAPLRRNVYELLRDGLGAGQPGWFKVASQPDMAEMVIRMDDVSVVHWEDDDAPVKTIPAE